MPTGSSPTARALQALELLQDRTTVTAAELAGRLGVSERAARRYVAILRDAGIPVESERGPAGGYRLGRGARLAPVVFEPAEALGLVMSVLEGNPGAADPADPIGAALSKVIRALPERVRHQAAALRDHASAAPDRHAARPDPHITSALILAVDSRLTVGLRYRSGAGREWDSLVDPWAVVVRHGYWYLLCRAHGARGDAHGAHGARGDAHGAHGARGDATAAVRTYRVDRIVRAELTDDGFTPPEGLDPVASLEEHLGAGWEFPVRVSFAAPWEQVAPQIHAPMGRLIATASGCELVGTTSNPAMYAQEWLSTVTVPFRIEQGEELRAAVTELAARCAAAVAEPAGPDGDRAHETAARRTQQRPDADKLASPIL